MSRITYKSGYKYQLQTPYQHSLPGVFKHMPVNQEFFEIGHRPGRVIDGRDAPGKAWLTIQPGYAWDGPSGPTVDTPDFMRGSLVHDVFYQMLRDGLLPAQIEVKGITTDLREFADYELWRICREDGMGRVRAWYVHQAVRRFGPRAIVDGGSKPLHRAP